MLTLYRRFAMIAASSLVLVALAACSTEPAANPTAVPTPVATPDPTAAPLATPDTTDPGTTDPPITENPAQAPASVESIQVVTLESFPLQAQIVVKGELPTPCPKIGELTNMSAGMANFTFQLLMFEPAPDQMCTQVISPYEQAFPLDITGTKAGTYTVRVNGVETQFTLTTDNVAP